MIPSLAAFFEGKREEAWNKNREPKEWIIQLSLNMYIYSWDKIETVVRAISKQTRLHSSRRCDLEAEDSRDDPFVVVSTSASQELRSSSKFEKLVRVDEIPTNEERESAQSFRATPFLHFFLALSDKERQ